MRLRGFEKAVKGCAKFDQAALRLSVQGALSVPTVEEVNLTLMKRF